MPQSPAAPVWIRALLGAAAAVIGFSVVLIVAPGLGQRLFNRIAFQAITAPADFPPAAIAYLEFVYTVLAAVMIGWMVAILFIVHIPFRRGEPWAWWAVAASLGLWFAIDTAMSLALGFPGNALLNTVFGITFAIPLAATRPMAARR